MNQKQYVRKKSKKKNFIIAICVVLFVAILLGIYLVIYNYDKVSYKDYDMYVYIGGTRYDVSGTVTVSKKSGVTELESEDKKYILTSNPLYFTKHKTWAMIPNDMLFVDLKDTKNLYKMNHYTILKSDGKAATATIRGEDKLLDPSLLFDGNDLYIFPYDTTVTIDGTNFELKGLSYILVNYHASVEIFNKNSESYLYLDYHNKDIIANTLDYEINLDTDTIIDNNNSRLLIKDIENLKEYK